MQPALSHCRNWQKERGGVVAQSHLLMLMRDVMDGVAYAHALGVVHRDLKPANILLFPGTDGRLHAKVSDYGLVKMMGEEYHRSQVTSVISLSQTGSNPAESEDDTFNRALIGTWEYMSPEQQEAGEVDPRSDVYTLGLILYRLLTGRKLSPWPPSHYDAAISKNLDVFVLRALEPEAADRFDNAGRMLEVFDEFFKRSDDEFRWTDPVIEPVSSRMRGSCACSSRLTPVLPIPRLSGALRILLMCRVATQVQAASPSISKKPAPSLTRATGTMRKPCSTH